MPPSNVNRLKPSQQSPIEPKSPLLPIFATVDDELRDLRRTQAQGQEEDLRYALDRVIKRVEELSSLLKTAYKTQAELEASLSVAKSNLTLVISNNEMLEEALRREQPVSAKDVGWRRWSAREAQNQEQRNSEERTRSLDCGSTTSTENGESPQPPSTVPINGKPGTTSPVLSPAPSTSEGRFFKFRFNGGSKSPLPPHPSHLTSPSLPSLVSSTREKEFEDLQEQLEKERKAHKASVDEKSALEAELESLSQALFEEANKMVATERIKRAETEEELQEIRLEKDALRRALRLIEDENGQLRSASVTAIENTMAGPSSGVLSDGTDLPSVGWHSRSSSRVALKSPLHSRTNSMQAVKDHVLDQASDVTVEIAQSPGSPSPTRDHLVDFSLEPAPKPSSRGVSLEDTESFKSLDSPLEPASDTDQATSGFDSPTVVQPPPEAEELSPWADAPSSPPPRQQAATFT
ncbi:hypothetical protein CONPUDRAFT_164114 [Coniophora puteana RWD-64-598 SS2]|uniref:GDP/GTP exchange factor Sec2 N-terminal domain-containing protein n=1 Tax=Coniophora puteana (strain RWD-64-598) TaxID=741705 RepID=A0A5M3MVF6_CONPW|nr:uncharacterized protein CONPUDRAFT_164114 [Coniophora puteana RWD-64-598 SS2]EIW83113.1 hypothetical protein CONPUDRAFT_164114 [Coniophora puteana RWD-64-598 SS2]